jgi:hypothetical protein
MALLRDKFSERGDPKPLKVFTSESAIRKLSLTPVFFDENRVEVLPEEMDKPFTYPIRGRGWRLAQSDGTFNNRASRQPQRVQCSTRCGARSKKCPEIFNMGFADGHSELAKLEKLLEVLLALELATTSQPN